MLTDLPKLKKAALAEIKRCETAEKLDEIRKKYLGKKGKLTLVLRSLKNLPKEEKIETGKKANQAKQEMMKLLKEKEGELKSSAGAPQSDWIDITLPGKKPVVGHLHPLTLVKRQVEEIFQGMGFSVVEGPEIEDEWHNFDALNIPQNHPARDMWDTFWIKNKGRKGKNRAGKPLLRTHTSPVQIRHIKKNNPPFRIIAPGRVFRYEAKDASHEINFYQLEGLMVGKDVSVSGFKAIIEKFFQKFFRKKIKIRLRPGYFPFVEPGFEIDMTCLNCGGGGCSACSRAGWMEMLGAGMVHPNVLKAGGLNPKNWQGFAFGVGIDRLAMMKYKINDIRLFYSGNLKFLEQF